VWRHRLHCCHDSSPQDAREQNRRPKVEREREVVKKKKKIKYISKRKIKGFSELWEEGIRKSRGGSCRAWLCLCVCVCENGKRSKMINERRSSQGAQGSRAAPHHSPLARADENKRKRKKREREKR
jgi:hypothetical protein